MSDKAPEYTGGSVDYYKVRIENPTEPYRCPYDAECNDIIEALGMTFAEGNAFKALWRRAAARTSGKPSADTTKDCTTPRRLSSSASVLSPKRNTTFPSRSD